MPIIYGKQASVKIGSALTSVAGTQNLWDQVSGTDFSAECKELSINPGEAGVDVLNVYGTQLVEESRPELVTADFTMVFSDIDIWKFNFATVAAPTGFERYSGQDATGSKTKRAIVFRVVNPSGTLHALMNNAYITAQGEMTLAADGSAEQTFSAACLINNFHVEDNY